MNAKKMAPQIKFHTYPRKKKKVLFKRYSRFLYKDGQILKKIRSKKSDYFYVLASKLPRMVERWFKDTNIKSLRYHLKALIKEEKVTHSINTLRQAYYIGECFPDLVSQPSKRILPLSCYREIAGADSKKVSETEKIKLREEAEDKGYTVEEIRDILHKRYEVGRKDWLEKRFTYSLPFVKFAKELEAYIFKHEEIVEGSEMKIRIKFPKKSSSQKPFASIFQKPQ